MLTTFHKQYDQIREPYRMLLAMQIVLPLIVGLIVLPYARSIQCVLACAAGVVYTLVLLISRIIYIHSSRPSFIKHTIDRLLK